MRTGVIARKIGMSSYFEKNGNKVPVTLVQVQNCQVVGHRTVVANGYNSLVVGAEDVKPSKVSKSLRVIYNNLQIEPKRVVREFRIAEDAFVEVGKFLTVSHFVVGQLVDIVGTSIGKGFAGGMKRHNFRGLEESHGVSVSHRSHGSTGACQDPGRVFKNKKMAGHLGDERVTKQNLKIVDIDVENNILVVKGSVPGAKGAILTVSDAVKVGLPLSAPYPTFSIAS
jgi:large subunit ribosomal protein L3